MIGTDEQQQLAVTEIDPDWNQHFHQIEAAISFYRNEPDFLTALYKIRREELKNDPDKRHKAYQAQMRGAAIMDRARAIPATDHNLNWPILGEMQSAWFEKDIERG